MKKSTAAADCYIRPPDFAALLAGVHFPPEVWAVFAQCDAPRSPAEIARRAKLEPAVVASALRRLARRRLVQKQQLDWQAYLASTGAPAGDAAGEIASASAPAPAPTPAPAPAPIPAASLVLSKTEPVAAPVATPVAAVGKPAAAPVLVFTVANPVADLARRRIARSTLAFTLGQNPAPPKRPVLAA